VQYVRFTILGNQVPDFATSCPNGGYDGCTYTDLTELQVYGVATP
jgi:extracellular elastinolytic metalloproteinase